MKRGFASLLVVFLLLSTFSANAESVSAPLAAHYGRMQGILLDQEGLPIGADRGGLVDGLTVEPDAARRQHGSELLAEGLTRRFEHGGDRLTRQLGPTGAGCFASGGEETEDSHDARL